jgi:hypothetical protein
VLLAIANDIDNGDTVDSPYMASMAHHFALAYNNQAPWARRVTPQQDPNNQ